MLFCCWKKFLTIRLVTSIFGVFIIFLMCCGLTPLFLTTNREPNVDFDSINITDLSLRNTFSRLHQGNHSKNATPLGTSQREQRDNITDTEKLYDFRSVWIAQNSDLWLLQDIKEPCSNVISGDYSKQKVIIFVASTISNFDRRQKIRQSWASSSFLTNSSSVLFRIVFVVGAGSNPDQVSNLKRERELNGDVVQADVRETYENLTLKVQMGIDWSVKFCDNFDYVVKTDDDMYLNLMQIGAFLEKQPKGKDIFGGRCLFKHGPHRKKDSKWHMSVQAYPRKEYPPFCVGAMYVMSMNIAKAVRSQYQHIAPLHLEDVFTGLCLNRIPFVPNVNLSPRVLNFTPKGSIDWPEQHLAIHFSSAYYSLFPQFHAALLTAAKEGRKIRSFKFVKSKNGTIFHSVIKAPPA